MKKYRKRTYYTEADKALMWDRWYQGESLHAIAQLFDRHHPSIRRILARTMPEWFGVCLYKDVQRGDPELMRRIAG